MAEQASTYSANESSSPRDRNKISDRAACLTDPNDEAVSGHRLYRKGLSDVGWAGLVRDSQAIDALERQNRVHPNHDPSRFDRLNHHIVLLKERVAEVVAEAVEVRRVEGTTLDAATAALRP
jgi:hypothetical protein